ncbi:hypothetical protein Q7P35_004187 [Cladosporium inversicolor]
MASTSPSTSASPAAITSPFLRLAHELRNRVYKYVFGAVGKATPLPHALTRTNKQIRSETRAMYYASIECIEITLRTFAQYDRTRKWLAEEDWSMFPALPHITILTYEVDRRLDITISCRREKVTPAHELPLQLAAHHSGWQNIWTRASESARLLRATINTYTKCLGLKRGTLDFSNRLLRTFTQVIRGGATWDIRRLEFSAANRSLLGKFVRLAEEKQCSKVDQR